MQANFSIISTGQKGLQTVYETLYDNAGPLIISVISSIAALIIFPIAVVPVLIISGTFLLTRAIIKINYFPTKMIVEYCDCLNKEYPYLKIALIVSSIVLLPQPFAMLAGIGIGFYLGCTRNLRKINQNYNASRSHNSELERVF